jgi:hypothetical protein
LIEGIRPWQIRLPGNPDIGCSSEPSNTSSAVAADNKEPHTEVGGRCVVDEPHTVIVTSGTAAGMTHTRPVVARVVRGDMGNWREAPIMVEFSLGMTWNGGRPPAWEELARRADLALADNGWTRTAEWTHHVWPGPIAQARVGMG